MFRRVWLTSTSMSAPNEWTFHEIVFFKIAMNGQINNCLKYSGTEIHKFTQTQYLWTSDCVSSLISKDNCYYFVITLYKKSVQFNFTFWFFSFRIWSRASSDKSHLVSRWCVSVMTRMSNVEYLGSLVKEGCRWRTELYWILVAKCWVVWVNDAAAKSGELSRRLALRHLCGRRRFQLKGTTIVEAVHEDMRRCFEATFICSRSLLTFRSSRRHSFSSSAESTMIFRGIMNSSFCGHFVASLWQGEWKYLIL